MFSCSKQSGNVSQTAKKNENAASTATKVMFKEITQKAGVDFTHQHGGTGERHFFETMGAGGGFLDYNNDGWLDIYLVQSGPLPDAADRSAAANRLLRNNGDGTFSDVTQQSGTGDTGYGVGCCFGDYDNDGYVDIYVTNYGPNQLYRNNGDGTFANVTQKAAVDNALWGTSAAFADYDRDGDLDLYVCNFVTYSMDTDIYCEIKGKRDYCSPDNFSGTPDMLYQNNGDGTFTDVTKAAGVYNDLPNESKGLGVMWFDYDNDGDLDIYIANDSTPNFLYKNNGDGTFTDIALELGVAYNENGETEAGMGVDAGDYNWDGNLDIFLTHWERETNTLYKNDASGFFEDATDEADLARTSFRMVGWGTKFIDVDNDGLLDIFIVNGHTKVNAEIQFPNSGITYAQSDQLFMNEGTAKFRDISATAGPYFQERWVGRGAAFGDIDNDGDLDILITNNNQRAILLENVVGQDKNWIGFDLTAQQANTNAIGARVEIVIDRQRRFQEIRSGTSYLSQNDLRLLFGLENGQTIDAATVRWPDGEVQVLPAASLKINAYNKIRKEGNQISLK